jgi:hypothetical protein
LVAEWQIYQMLNTITGEIITYAEWQRRTCGGLLDDGGAPPEPARVPQPPPCPARTLRQPGDGLVWAFFERVDSE